VGVVVDESGVALLGALYLVHEERVSCVSVFLFDEVTYIGAVSVTHADGAPTYLDLWVQLLRVVHKQTEKENERASEHEHERHREDTTARGA
jgi:hypothetical protein